MSGHFVSDFPDSGSVDYSDQSTNLDETAIAELNELAGRYPQPRSALLPMLHLVQSYDGRISPRGIELCAEILGITKAQVSGVATFYTMFKRHDALGKMDKPPEFRWAISGTDDIRRLISGVEIIEEAGLSSVCKPRYPWLLRLVYATAWGRCKLDMRLMRIQVPSS